MIKKTYTFLSLLAAMAGIVQASARDITYQVNPADISGGYISQRIWLNSYTLPKVSISGITYSDVPKPAEIADARPEDIKVVLGMERKKPFMVVRVPAYAAGTGATAKRVSAFTLNYDEPAAAPAPAMAAKPTAAANSVLANGTWYKIAVTKTGFYKLDHAFLTSLGVKPADINPSHIRIYGNGGNMLSEANYEQRFDDLRENAIVVNDGGDNVFNDGDFAMFYATGPLAWKKDSVNQRFNHQVNIYSDTAYYFVTFDQGPGLRVSGQSGVGTPNKTVTEFNYYDVHDIDLVNPAGIGKSWYGEQFSSMLGNTTQTFTFDLGAPASSAYFRVLMGCVQKDMGGSRVTISVNGQYGATGDFASKNDEYNVMGLTLQQWQTNINSSTVNVGLSFAPSTGTAIGYLDYVEINARRQLSITGDQMNFRDWQSVGAGNVASYQLQGANSSTRVWDVTDRSRPVLMNGSLSGSTYTFTQDAGSLHEFAVFNSSNVFVPKFIKKVANQNLHGVGLVDMIIVTNERFASQANRLADYHRQHDGFSVLVANNEQIYNEFSSGAQDISAIRDLTRMFYLRAGTDSSKMPKYLLLLGGASYDYKNRLPDNSNFVPVFESDQASNSISAYSTDDFYGFLDDNENIENPAALNTLDIGVGRLPARNEEQAEIMVNKIVNYKSAKTLGPWRTAATVVADNGYWDGQQDSAGDHMEDAEVMSAVVDNVAQGLHNQTKIYEDAIPIISTPGGHRCPGANSAINDRVFKGTFMINYNGHGNPQVWSHERILTKEDFGKWNNEYMLPFMITATCDFGQFDHPQYISAAEQLVHKNRGGVIVVLTTTAAVYANYNRTINRQYLGAQFLRNSNGRWNSFGDAARIGKNMTYISSVSRDELANFYKFALLGDPALQPNFPEHFIHIDEIKDGVSQANTTEIKALGKYVITGHLKSRDGNAMNDFNGLLWLSLYDKPRSIVTLTGNNDVFKMQDNIVYKGKVNVVNGKFEVVFIAPKDINYNMGSGKISAYAHNGSTDAAGADTNLTVGGFSDSPQLSDAKPIVRPYINDSLFLNGGITGSNTSLFVILQSETGINVTGSNLGHDLIGILDENVEQPYILNDYYETAPNTYQKGYVTFPVSGLSNGRHTIRVKAWDVNNNSGEGTVDFEVVDGKVVEIQNLGNYPNPFANSTRFVFEHNHPDELMDVDIAIFNTGGALVRTIKQQFTPSGSRTNELTWDGTDNNGARLPSGLYVYKLNIATEKGFRSVAYQKLVIVR